MSVHPFTGARRMRPTKRHVPVIWECMLGTVYAASPAGEVRYFDYRWEDARAFAEVPLARDLRVARSDGFSYYRGKGPGQRQFALWAVRP